MQTAVKRGRMIEFSNRVVVPPHVLVRHLDGESVLLNLETERYFGLDATGTRMWELITSQPDIDQAFQKLRDEFEVDPDELRRHLTELLTSLVENGLLSTTPADVGSSPKI